MKKIYFLISILFLFASCESDYKSHHEQKNSNQLNITKPTNFGNGVYYFESRKEDFARSLSKFLSDGTKTVLAISGNGTEWGTYGSGSDIGYFVIVKEK